MSPADLEDVYTELATIALRSEAERLRLAAVELAREYERLVDRGLEPEIVDDDTAAVARAWQRLASRDP